jgi:hypothetical protein
LSKALEILKQSGYELCTAREAYEINNIENTALRSKYFTH